MFYRISSYVLALIVITGLLTGKSDVRAQSQVDEGRVPTLDENPELIQTYFDSIDPDALAAHLYLFASDHFEGREATSRGQRLAAHYLAAQHQRLGIEPAGTIGTEDPLSPESYYQKFELEEERLVSARLSLVLGGDTLLQSTFTPRRQDGLSFPSFGTDVDREGGVIFAGYGIGDDNLGYNDYAALADAEINPQGQWLLILRDEPLANDSTSLLPTAENQLSSWTTQWSQKLLGAYQFARPAGILLVGDVGPRAEMSIEDQAELEALRRQGVGQLSLPGQGRGLQSRLPPVFSISAKTADRLIGESGRTIEEIQQEINSTLEPIVFEVERGRAHGTIESKLRMAPTENVLGMIEGSDPVLKDEVVVLLAHYDHEGYEYGAEGDKMVYNGADDNGSGSVALIKLAKAFSRAAAEGFGPRRTILFLHVTAEEKGLLGSAYYTDVDPFFPLENTVAALNLDMIGRYDPTHPTESKNYVYIIGSYLISQDLHDINVKANEVTGIDLELDERFNDPQDPNMFYRRSDQWNFGKHGIPFIFFFTGTHEDYHAPGDEPHKIDYERMARITRLVFATAWQLANQDDRPEITGEGFN